jgi:hypothetical protein
MYVSSNRRMGKKFACMMGMHNWNGGKYCPDCGATNWWR